MFCKSTQSWLSYTCCLKLQGSFAKHTTIIPHLLLKHYLFLSKLYTFPCFNGHQFAQDNFIFTISKFTDPYFAKWAAVCILKNHRGIFSLSFLLTLVIYLFFSVIVSQQERNSFRVLNVQNYAQEKITDSHFWIF